MCIADPIVVSLSRIGLAQLTRRLFGYSNKYGAGQFAITTDERCVVGLVVLAKNGRWPGVGVFFDQGFVGRAIMVKFCADRRLSCLHQGRFGPNKIFAVIRKDSRVEFVCRQ
jgi:hypothetical protein